MSLFGHHAEAYFQIEINGRGFPDGMTEHALAIAVAVVAIGVMGYGIFSAVRDLIRWRTRRASAATGLVRAGA
ncbi:MAG: hypothetical protein JWO38_2015 [Gemmataceae bacterium]|nr:hypothetical protein [Gemmataceae bacterium]